MPPKRKNLKLWLVDESPDEPLGTSARSESVGAQLRAARTRNGWTLDQISAALRIRGDYLQAIEDGRHDRLPGRIYTIGFVRAYAQILGMNGEEMVARLKADLGDRTEPRELVFPEPVTERRVPGGAILSVCVTLVIGVYATWYMQTAQNPLPRDLFPTAPTAAEDGRPVEGSDGPVRLAMQPPMRPPPTTSVLDRVLEPTAAGPAPQTSLPPAGMSPAPAAALPQTGPSSGPSLPLRLPVTTTSAPTIPVPSAPSTRVPASAEPSAAVAAALPAPGPAPTSAAAPTPHPAPAQIARGPIDQIPGFPPASRGGGPAQAAEVPPGAQLAALPAPPPPAEPVRSGPPRIEVRAIEPTWIEVRSELTGEIVHGKLLKAGDVYVVPERPGLKLTTGNAGGMDIVVNGEAVPKVGPRGAVVRGISLEGERLLAGPGGTIRN